ncbi:MAG TPA: hypothetical protein VNN13_07375 [Methylomirabilota bacterium]|nr:hypothetical protein [Methylomirabilota bacterium]
MRSFDLAKEYLPADPLDGPIVTAITEPDESPEDRIIAVKICSHVLDACVWLSFIDDFQQDPEDEQLAVFYADEIPLLQGKTPEQLQQIHATKLAFPGTRVTQ